MKHTRMRTKKRECSVQACHKAAEFRFSPDMDIAGLGACKKHTEQVRVAYAALLFNGETLCKQLLQSSIQIPKPRTITNPRSRTK